MQRSRNHSMALVRPRASYTASPLWTCTIFASVKDWNQLTSMVAEAGTLSTFKARLTGLSQIETASIGVLPCNKKKQKKPFGNCGIDVLPCIGPCQLKHKTQDKTRLTRYLHCTPHGPVPISHTSSACPCMQAVCCAI